MDIFRGVFAAIILILGVVQDSESLHRNDIECISHEIGDCSKLVRMKNTKDRLKPPPNISSSTLDLSCLIRKSSAPDILNSQPPRYQRRKKRGKKKHKSKIGSFLIAAYECQENYELKNDHGVLFCSKGEWVGQTPECISKQDATTTELPSTLSDSADESCEENRVNCDHACRLVAGEPQCICFPGFILQKNNTCQDINECATLEDLCSHECRNLPGSYECLCPEGYRLEAGYDPGSSCLDTNECLLNNGHGPCQDVCKNIAGSYSCSCERLPGTRLDLDGHTCVPGDACLDAGCSHECLSARGDAFCLCPSGMQLGDDWKHCDDIDECASDDIRQSCVFGCLNTIGSYYCTEEPKSTTMKPDVECDNGYEKDLDGSCKCPEEHILSTDNETCIEIKCSHDYSFNKTLTCHCPFGYQLNSDQVTCEDVNECDLDHKCSQTCHNTPGSYKCDCRLGFDLQDDGKCVDIDECDSKNGCSHICENVLGSYKCLCQNGYELLEDEKECTLMDLCSFKNDCSHICENTAIGYKCMCEFGYHLLEDGITCADLNECELENNCTQLCVNEPGYFSCGCNLGYSLLDDEITCVNKIDECKQNNCSHICINGNESYSCSCEDGYVLQEDEITCKDVDECQLQNKCSQICENEEGSYTCFCHKGYQLIDRHICIDINECDSNICSQTCVNNPGSFNCTCLEGYILEQDGTTCISMLAPCPTDHNCSQICNNTMGSYTCLCEPGYNLLEDGITCDDINECESNHNCSQLCENQEGSFACTCDDGYELLEDEITCLDINECLYQTEEDYEDEKCEHMCLNYPGTFSCGCNSGYKLQEDGYTCEVMDECLFNNGNCSQICENLSGSLKCYCNPGYQLEEDGSTCVQVNKCLENNGNCSHICESLKGEIKCICNSGYQLEEDHRACVDIDECLYNNNNNNNNITCTQICVNMEGSYRCECNAGYALDDTGVHCEDIDECIDNYNNNCSQICLNLEGSFECSCKPGYTLEDDGQSCLEENTCDLENGGCSHGCEFDGEDIICTCPEHYILMENKYCVEPCKINNGNCSQTCTTFESGEVHCLCLEGFEVLELFNCVKINGCLVDNGGCSHFCHFIHDEIKCSCSEDYELRDKLCFQLDPCFTLNGGCSHDCSSKEGEAVCGCPFGYYLDDKTCLDIDECKDVGTRCEHICTNLQGTFECHCFQGYQLINNSICIDIDECLEENGNCSHRCTNTKGSFECSCFKGYVLQKDGNTCDDINECLNNNGGCSNICANLEGTFRCECPAGYTLDDSSINCLDLNECLVQNGGCSDICMNLNGKYRCDCPEGFELDEFNITCVDHNECMINNGGCQYTCVNTVGSYQCENPISKCLKLKAPSHGRSRCMGEPLPDGRHWSYRSKCVVWCDKGYKLNGPPLRTCLSDGTWGDHHEMSCIPVSCPRLGSPTHGRLLPTTCSTGKIFPGDLCRLSCRRGYKPAPWANLGPGRTIRCLSTLSWESDLHPDQIQEICIRDFPKPFIKCPGDGQLAFTVAPGQRTVNVKIPRPVSNMDWWRYVNAVPSWGMQLAATLPVGHHDITYHAWSPVNNSTIASCHVTIHVVDKEAPIVLECPEDIQIRLRPGVRGQYVHWREPRFMDNVGVSLVHKNKNAGDYFEAGFHRVIYTASDNDKNTAICEFTVQLKEATILVNQFRSSDYSRVLVCPGGIHTALDVQQQLQNHIPIETGCHWRRLRKARQHTRHHRSRAATRFRCCDT